MQTECLFIVKPTRICDEAIDFCNGSIPDNSCWKKALSWNAFLNTTTGVQNDDREHGP